jgi:hypothetical protein
VNSTSGFPPACGLGEGGRWQVVLTHHSIISPIGSRFPQRLCPGRVLIRGGDPQHQCCKRATKF